MLKDQIYLYINKSIDETFKDIGRLNNKLDTILDVIIKNIVKTIKKDELNLFNTVVKNILLYCRFYNITDINNTKYLNIKCWIDLVLLGNIMLIVNLVYLNMISDKVSLKFMIYIPLDGNNCLFLFKILVTLANKYNNLLNTYCLEYDLGEILDDNLLKSFNKNLDRFIISVGGEENTNMIIRQYIRDQIVALKEYNDQVTNAIIRILGRSSNVVNSGLREEIIKNNSVLSDELIKKFN